MTSQYQLVVADETDQKQTDLNLRGNTSWAEVSAQSVELLDLPTHVGGEPVIYHIYDDKTGEALLPGESVSDVVQEAEERFRVRLAPEMKPAC